MAGAAARQSLAARGDVFGRAAFYLMFLVIFSRVLNPVFGLVLGPVFHFLEPVYRRLLGV